MGIREEIGAVLKSTELPAIADSVDRLFKDRHLWASRLESVADETVFNLGRSAVVGADYLESIMFGEESSR